MALGDIKKKHQQPLAAIPGNQVVTKLQPFLGLLRLLRLPGQRQPDLATLGHFLMGQPTLNAPGKHRMVIRMNSAEDAVLRDVGFRGFQNLGRPEIDEHNAFVLHDHHALGHMLYDRAVAFL